MLRKTLAALVACCALQRCSSVVVAANSTVTSKPSKSPEDAQALRASKQLALEYLKNETFSGVWQVLVNGNSKFRVAMGYANQENHVPMEYKSVIPIGSNTKLFTAVAMYQLQEQGKVNLSLPVNAYLDKKDFESFGVPNTSVYCPKMSPKDDCQSITFTQLLSMSSGLPDSFNCDNVPKEYCRAEQFFGVYNGTIAYYVGLFINDPLVFQPGTNYSYSNPNFILASYMIEKLSGMSLQDYFQEKIFEPLGLMHTYYDPFDGEYGVIDRYANQYFKFFDANSMKPIATGSCQPFLPSGSTNGAGGMLSTVDDIATWYMDLFANQGKTSQVLSEASLKEIVKKWTPMPGQEKAKAYYGQGIVISYADFQPDGSIGTEEVKDWPSLISYCGGTICANTCIEMLIQRPSGSDSTLTRETSVIAAAFNNQEFVMLQNASILKDLKTQPASALVESPYVELVDGNAGEVRSTLMSIWAFGK